MTINKVFCSIKHYPKTFYAFHEYNWSKKLLEISIGILFGFCVLLYYFLYSLCLNVTVKNSAKGVFSSSK